MGRLLTLLRKKNADFSPVDLPGLALWLDASDESTITHDTGAVSQWDDKSGLGRHVVQATAAEQPTTGIATINGLNALSFDGGDRLATAAANSISQPFTVFAVVQVESGGGTAPYVWANAGASTVSLVSLISTNNLRAFSGTGLTFKTGITFGAPHVLRSVHNGVSSSAAYDGTAVTGNMGTGPLNLISIGSTGAGAAYLTGKYCEQIVYEGALLAPDIASTEAYLAAKWGVTLA